MQADYLLEALSHLGTWSVGGLWLPLLAWTLVAALALVLDAHLPLRRPVVRQRMLVALLVALPVGVTLRTAAPVYAPQAAITLLNSLWPGESMSAVEPAVALDAPVATAPATAPSPATRPLLPLALGGLTALALAGMVGGLLFLALRHVVLHQWLRALPIISDAAMRAQAQKIAARMGVARLHVRIVDADVSPFTCGLVRPFVVLPARLSGDADALRLAVTHEAAHLYNSDGIWHVIGRMAQAFVPWHSLARRLLHQAVLRSEQAADTCVLAHFPRERRAYAHLLLRYSTLPAPVVALSASVHHLNPRVSAMKHVLDLRARGLAPALLLLVSFSCVLSLQAQDSTNTTPPAEVFVVVEQPPRLIGGLEAIQAQMRYPQAAKDAGIQGRVIVQFVVDENGGVQDARIVRGIGGGADEEALRVVQSARFEPGKQRGEAVKVQMTLPITFKLAADEQDQN